MLMIDCDTNIDAEKRIMEVLLWVCGIVNVVMGLGCWFDWGCIWVWGGGEV